MFRDTIVFLIVLLILCNQILALKYLQHAGEAYQNGRKIQHKGSMFWKRELVHGSQVIPSDFVQKDSQPSKKVDVKDQINPNLNKNRNEFPSEKLSDYVNINDKKQSMINIDIKINISIEKEKNKKLNNQLGKADSNQSSSVQGDLGLSNQMKQKAVKANENSSIVEEQKEKPVTNLPTPFENLTEKGKDCLNKCVSKGGISCKYWNQPGVISCCHPGGCQFPISCEEDKVILVDDCQNRK